MNHKGSDAFFEHNFDHAKKQFDSQTQESMTRRPMTNEDLKKQIPFPQLLFGLSIIVGSNKLLKKYLARA